MQEKTTTTAPVTEASPVTQPITFIEQEKRTKGANRISIHGGVEVSNPYTILNVKPTATAIQIKQSYIALAQVLHPDINPAEKKIATSLTAELNTAYALLKNPEKRKLVNDAIAGKNATKNDYSSMDSYGTTFNKPNSSTKKKRTENPLEKFQTEEAQEKENTFTLLDLKSILLVYSENPYTLMQQLSLFREKLDQKLTQQFISQKGYDGIFSVVKASYAESLNKTITSRENDTTAIGEMSENNLSAIVSEFTNLYDLIQSALESNYIDTALAWNLTARARVVFKTKITQIYTSFIPQVISQIEVTYDNTTAQDWSELALKPFEKIKDLFYENKLNSEYFYVIRKVFEDQFKTIIETMIAQAKNRDVLRTIFSYIKRLSDVNINHSFTETLIQRAQEGISASHTKTIESIQDDHKRNDIAIEITSDFNGSYLNATQANALKDLLKP